MSREVTIPEISEGIEEAEVARILVEKGDEIKEEQALLELESEKASVELPAPFAGTVEDILVSEGDTVKVGQAVLTMEAGETGTAKETAGEDESADEKPAQPKEDNEEQSPAESETEPREEDKAAEAQAEPTEESEEKEAEEEEQPAKAEPSEEQAAPPPASPSVRRLARHLGVNLAADVKGSGPGGRVTAGDVKDQAGGGEKTKTEKAGAPQKETQERAQEETRKTAPETGDQLSQKMNKIGRITAATMTESWQTIPHVTQYDKTDITWFSVFRREYGDRVEAAGGKLTITSVIIKVVTHALQAFPRFNSTLDLENQQIKLNNTLHIGVAVDTDRGLLVPVIRDCDTKSISEIAAELVDKADRSRSGKISPEEMQGGGFTISNLGSIGGTAFAPIIYPPQVAILGISRASIEPVFEAEEFQPRKIMPLSLSYDHRVIDGAEGARFLHWICEALSAPMLMELE